MLQIFPAESRTGTTESQDFENLHWRGAHFIIEVTEISDNAITVEIQGKNPNSGNYYPVLTSLPMTDPGIRVLKIDPEFAGRLFRVAGDFLPVHFRVVVTHLNNNPAVYSIDAALSV